MPQNGLLTESASRRLSRFQVGVMLWRAHPCESMLKFGSSRKRRHAGWKVAAAGHSPQASVRNSPNYLRRMRSRVTDDLGNGT
jgi:hypothetical protein